VRGSYINTRSKEKRTVLRKQFEDQLSREKKIRRAAGEGIAIPVAANKEKLESGGSKTKSNDNPSLGKRPQGARTGTHLRGTIKKKESMTGRELK